MVKSPDRRRQSRSPLCCWSNRKVSDNVGLEHLKSPKQSLCLYQSSIMRRAVAWRYFSSDVVPIGVECEMVVSTLILPPLSIIFGRSSRLLSVKSPLFFNIFLLGLLAFTFTLSVMMRLMRLEVFIIEMEIPGQRCLALNLLASLLDKALSKLCQSGIGQQKVQSTDWEAIWAYALGPEPGLVLALRMALDDNHASVVLACAKVIQCLLSCSLNENFFDLMENMGPCGKDMFTAPVFRGKPEIDLGLLPGCFWKYSAKPSNIVPFREEIMDDGTEDTDTIQKDVFVAGQDVAAGLVRMDILPRIYHLLETEATAALEECLISVTIAIARHSPKCTTAILKYPKFVQTIVKRFKLNKRMDVLPSQIYSVRLLKFLARYDKRTCMEFVKNGTFNEVTWHLFQFTSSLDSWVKLGKHKCKLSSDLMVEQLRFLKVCIQSGCCISQYPELFPALCLWLSCPSFEKLKENNLIREFASVSKEAYLVLEAFAGTLPSLYSQNIRGNESGAWDWRYVSPMIDTALSWIMLAPELLEWERGIESVSVSTTSLLWLYSGVIRTISKVLDKISSHGEEEPLPWLPEFVPKIGLTIIKHKLLSFAVAKDPSKCSSFMEFLCLLRENLQDEELALASSLRLLRFFGMVVVECVRVGLDLTHCSRLRPKRIELLCLSLLKLCRCYICPSTFPHLQKVKKTTFSQISCLLQNFLTCSCSCQ
ncbi:hypothetical protein F2Q68_00026934 [Brassica cretica]|uniref:Uncharacterized protein n=1 Tax=Brassica cretica TaxID=69181 RepID=A0A8S9I7G6_BRACR|nr:hypothetical protein F2Q68_00026934 [Brassica cretica]